MSAIVCGYVRMIALLKKQQKHPIKLVGLDVAVHLRFTQAGNEQAQLIFIPVNNR